MKRKLRTCYDAFDVCIGNNSPSLTDESYADYTSTAWLVEQGLGLNRMQTYGDNTVFDFETLQQQKARVTRAFNRLSPEDRAKFGTPLEFLRYCSNPSNFVSKEQKEQPEIKEE